MNKQANAATALMKGLSGPLLIGTAIGTGAYAYSKVKRMNKETRIRNKADGYDRHIAQNLRSGELNRNNLSMFDMETADNMYKISSLQKSAFLGTAFSTAMSGMFALDMNSRAKEFKSKYAIKDPRLDPILGNNTRGV